MDLVDEEHGALPVLTQPALGLGEGLPHVLHAGGGRRQGDQMLGGGGGEKPGQGRFPRARRPPQDGGSDTIALGQRAQRGPGRHEMLLAHHLVQRPRPQACGQRGLTLQVALGGLGEKAQIDVVPGVAGGATVRIPSSARAPEGRALGAPVRRSAPDCVFG